MKWFEYATGRDAEGVPTHFDILTNARRRRVFSTENPAILRKCLTLKGAGMLSGGEDPSTLTANFRLTGKGHQILKEKPCDLPTTKSDPVSTSETKFDPSSGRKNTTPA